MRSRRHNDRALLLRSAHGDHAVDAAQQREEFNPRVPVNVAYVATEEEDLESSAGIIMVMNDSDDWCIAWTVIWYKGLTGHSIETWTPDKLDRFTALRAHRAWLACNAKLTRLRGSRKSQ